QPHEMNVPIVEEKVILVARRHAARLTVLRQCEGITVPDKMIIVATLRPEGCLPKHFWKHPKDRCVELRIAGCIVSVVPKHQPYIGIMRAAVVGVSIAHRGRSIVSGAGITDRPNPNGFAALRGCHKPITAAGSEHAS